MDRIEYKQRGSGIVKISSIQIFFITLQSNRKQSVKEILICRNGGMVDTRDLKSLGTEVLCGFESHFLYIAAPGVPHIVMIGKATICKQLRPVCRDLFRSRDMRQTERVRTNCAHATIHSETN